MSFEALLGNLAARADLRGREFERICKWFLRNAPEYRSQLREVWLWDEWPGRWAADAGIDLVAETVDGGLWAIQAKAYSPAYTIKKADIDSFLSESARPEFDYRLLIGTTDRIGKTAQRTLDGQEKPAGVLLRSQLAVAEVAWPASPADLRPRAPVRKRARPHQRKAVAAIVRGFGSTDRGQLVMACGTGKTLAACFLAQKLAARRVLVLVPSLSLLAQTLREWALAAEFNYLAVCSDDTVTHDETDALVATTSELGFPATTDPAVIARFLRQRGDGLRVVFATYQSSPRVAEAQARRTPAFDLVIADEAHRCAGPEAGLFATVLDQAKIKTRKRLFMTATPKYFTGRIRKEAKEVDWEVASMDDETRFGPVLHRLSFARAIKQGLLSDYQVAVVGVTDSTYRDYAERGVFVTADGETVTDARTLARQLGLLRAMSNYNLRRVVTFHSRIRSASAFARTLPNVCAWLPKDRRPDGPLWAERVSGDMTSSERDSRLNRLRTLNQGERGVLTNARCLAEGVDVPTLDGVAFIDPRRSQVDVVQAVGRAIRKAEDKALGTVVIPVFVAEDADPAAALETSEFDRVWQVVRALRDHDEELSEELDELRRELGRRGTVGARPSKIVLDIPVEIGDAFARAFDSKVVETTTAAWHQMFGVLMDFKEHVGHTNPHPDLKYRGAGLGTWCVHQRVLKRNGRLQPERERLLREVGFDLAPRDNRFDDDCTAIERHIETEGHLPRHTGETRDERRLANNIRLWRSQRESGRLPEWKRRRLDEINGFYWTVLEDTLAPIAAFINVHGRRPGEKRGATADERRLAARLRAVEKRQLAPSEAELVRAVLAGVPPPKRRDAVWFETADHLESFVRQSGSLPRQGANAPEEARLATWMNTQRTAAASGSLGQDRVARLDRIPGWFWKQDLDQRFREDADLVEAHVRRYGVLPNRESRDPEEARLARWCSSRKMEARGTGRRRLAAWRRERLKQIPGFLTPES